MLLQIQVDENATKNTSRRMKEHLQVDENATKNTSRRIRRKLKC